MQVFTSLYIHVFMFVQNKKNVLKRGLLGYVLRQSWAVFCRNLRICDLRISHENLLILDSGMSPRICGFADCKKRFVPNLCWIAAWDLVTLANNWVSFWDNWLLKQKSSQIYNDDKCLLFYFILSSYPFVLKNPSALFLPFL